jgi:hypothetical protein
MNAKELFVKYTGGYINRVYGPANAAKRAEILSALRGEKVPKSRAGWSVFWFAMMELYEVPEGCTAARDAMLTEIVKGDQ